MDGVECVYSDRKREKARKELIESKSSVLDLQAKNDRLANLLADLIAESNIDSDARTQAVQFMEDLEHEDMLQNVTSNPGSARLPRDTTGQNTPTMGDKDPEHFPDQPEYNEPSRWRSPSEFNLVGPSRLSHLSRLILTDNEPSPHSQRPSAWTQTTNNDNLVQHLIALYFCWEYPVFASLSREHFLLDFHTGNQRFCSPLLVNAILALGARYSDLPEARKHEDNPSSAGDHFYEEAQRLLGYEDVPSLTKVQALGLMSLRQASCGNDMSGWHLSRYAMRTALDLGLHMADSQDRRADRLLYSNPERQVSAATFWGCYTLEQAWSLCVGRQSQVTPEEVAVQKPIKIDEIEHEPWRPYSDQGVDPDPTLHQPSNMRSVYKIFAELAQLVHKTNLCLQSEDTRDITSSVRALYTEYLQFYSSLPDALRLGRNSTPPVLFAQPFYNTGIFDTVPATRLICIEATENILSLLKAYQSLYSLRRTPAFMPYIVMSAELARMADHKTRTTVEGRDREVYRTPSIRYLRELALSHPFAVRAMLICKFFVDGWKIDLAPEDDCEVPFGLAKNEDGMTLSHAVTFFRPDEDLERHHTGHASSSPLSHRPTSRLRFVPFPQQGAHLGIMALL
ncbi:hypothetical protein LTS17_011855 [Exophiala oligosperma]